MSNVRKLYVDNIDSSTAYRLIHEIAEFPSEEEAITVILGRHKYNMFKKISEERRCSIGDLMMDAAQFILLKNSRVLQNVVSFDASNKRRYRQQADLDDPTKRNDSQVNRLRKLINIYISDSADDFLTKFAKEARKTRSEYVEQMISTASVDDYLRMAPKRLPNKAERKRVGIRLLEEIHIAAQFHASALDMRKGAWIARLIEHHAMKASSLSVTEEFSPHSQHVNTCKRGPSVVV